MTYSSYAHEIYPSQRPTQRPPPQTDPTQQSPPTYASCINQPNMASTQGHALPVNQQPTSSRKFLIRMDSFWRSGLIVMSPDGKTPLYKVLRLSGRGPQLIVRTATAPSTVRGTVRFHHFSYDIDIMVRSSFFNIGPRGFFKPGLCYASPAWNGGNLSWKRKSFFSRQMICLYEREVVVAKLGRGHGGFKNIGEIEVNEAAMQRAPRVETAVIEETIVVALAIIELIRRDRNRKRR